MKEVAYIRKDTTVQTFKAVSYDYLISLVRPKFLEHGIVITTSQTKDETKEREKKWDKFSKTEITDNQRLYIGTYEITFFNVEKPTDKVVVSMEAHALDAGDKGPGKAATYATKVAILKILSLECGENEESVNPENRPGKPAITTQQAEQIKSRAEALNMCYIEGSGSGNRRLKFFTAAESLSKKAVTWVIDKEDGGFILYQEPVLRTAFAYELSKEGLVKMGCLASIGARLSGSIESAKGADEIITIDGCPVACAKKALELTGVTPKSIILTKLGLVKGKTHVTEKKVEEITAKVKKKMPSGTQQPEKGGCCQ